MPRKRRKRIATDGAPDIPYPRVRVEWIDCVSDSGWATDKEFDKMKQILEDYAPLLNAKQIDAESTASESSLPKPEESSSDLQK